MVDYIFIDIDGVLNNHNSFDNGYCPINYSCVKAFNCLLNEWTEAKVIISSSWRYLILSKQMTITGFESMLLTYGLDIHGRLFGYTRASKRHLEDDSRYKEIKDWVEENNCQNWIVLDDLFLSNDRRFFKINPKTGLDLPKVNQIIQAVKSF